MAIRLCVAYLMVVAGMYLFQRHLMYVPSNTLDAPDVYGLENTQNVTLTTQDGVKIHAWYHPARNHMPLLLYFHGNADNLRVRAPKLKRFAQEGFGYFIVSYRGFGQSEGKPSEAGIYLDGEAAAAYVKDTLGLPLNQVMLYGESLGTGVAVEMATRHPFGGLVLEAPYTSVRRRSQELFWWTPAYWLVHDHYNSLAKITQLTLPIMIFHGENDRVIPIEHGRELFEAANEPKTGHFFPGVTHFSFDYGVLATKMREFGQKHGLINQVN